MQEPDDSQQGQACPARRPVSAISVMLQQCAVQRLTRDEYAPLIITPSPNLPATSSSFLHQPHGNSLAQGDGRHRRSTLDGMVWGERSKDDFNMLAQLQKVRLDHRFVLRLRLFDLVCSNGNDLVREVRLAPVSAHVGEQRATKSYPLSIHVCFVSAKACRATQFKFSCSRRQISPQFMPPLSPNLCPDRSGKRAPIAPGTT